MNRPLVRTGAFALLGVGLLLTAYLQIMTTWMVYDDEGYVLMSIRQFLSGQALYDQVFTQYGPWPFVYHFILRLPFSDPITHMFGRELTAIHWTGCAGFSGLIAYRLAREQKVAVGLFTTLAVFSFLWQMANEPSHPGSLISLTLAAAAAGGVWALQTRRLTVVGNLVGITAALLLFTKINVGLLFICGAGAAALRLTEWGKSTNRWADGGALLGLLALPWVLMIQGLSEPRYFYFALQFTFAAAAWIWISPPADQPRPFRPPTWLIAAGTALAVMAAITVVVLLRGSSLSSLIQAVFLQPLHHAANFKIPLRYGAGTAIITAIVLAVAGRAGWEIRRHGKISTVTRRATIVGRLLFAAALVAHAHDWASYPGLFAYGTTCLSLFPLWLIPLREEPAPAVSGRFWFTAIALPQVLHTYPIAGSQLGWGMFLTLPLLAVGLFDAIETLRSSRSWAPWIARTTLVGASAFQVAVLAQDSWRIYVNSEPLAMPGAEDIRLDAGSRIAVQNLTLNARLYADVLFSRPGMYCFNLWSNVPTPTDRNATQWFWLLTATEQQSIVDRLASGGRSLIITSRPIEDLLKTINVPFDGPLNRYLESHYEPWVAFHDFAVLAPKGSLMPPVGLAELFVIETPDPTQPAPPVLWRTHVWIDGTPTQVQLQSLLNQSPLPATPLRARLQPITDRGELWGAPIDLPATAPLHGLFRLEVEALASTQTADYAQQALVITNSANSPLAEALFK